MCWIMETRLVLSEIKQTPSILAEDFTSVRADCKNDLISSKGRRKWVSMSERPRPAKRLSRFEKRAGKADSRISRVTASPKSENASAPRREPYPRDSFSKNSQPRRIADEEITEPSISAVTTLRTRLARLSANFSH